MEGKFCVSFLFEHCPYQHIHQWLMTVDFGGAGPQLLHLTYTIVLSSK